MYGAGASGIQLSVYSQRSAGSSSGQISAMCQMTAS